MPGRYVLVIAPHPDDESIGCGGTIYLHTQSGDRVHVVVLTSGERGLRPPDRTPIREMEVRDAAEVLGVEQISFLRLPDLRLVDSIQVGAQLLHNVFNSGIPDLIYLPHPEEAHIDHGAVLPMVRAALSKLEKGAKRPLLLGYEVWTPLAVFDVIKDISGVIQQKLRAVRCHHTQIRHFRHDHAVRGLARYRGVMTARGRYVEVFRELERSVFTEILQSARWYARMPSRFHGVRRIGLHVRNMWRRTPQPPAQ